MFGGFGFKEKLFECSPDAYAGVVYAYNSASLQRLWGGSVLAI